MDKSIIKYDVFLSFSSSDIEYARSIWSELTSNGLKVFWSDETLKRNAGKSFFSEIDHSLMQSNHFVLLCTKNSLTSNWVQEEYQAFFSQCYLPSNRERRLILFTEKGYKTSALPALLTNLQQVKSVDDLVKILLGNEFIEEIKDKISIMQKKLDESKKRNADLYKELEKHKQNNQVIEEKNEEISQLYEELENMSQQINDEQNNKEDAEEQLKIEINKKNQYILKIQSEKKHLSKENNKIINDINRLNDEKSNLEKNYSELLLLLDQQNDTIKKLKKVTKEPNETKIFEILRELDSNVHEKNSYKNKLQGLSKEYTSYRQEKENILKDTENKYLELHNEYNYYRQEKENILKDIENKYSELRNEYNYYKTEKEESFEELNNKYLKLHNANFIIILFSCFLFVSSIVIFLNSK